MSTDMKIARNYGIISISLSVFPVCLVLSMCFISTYSDIYLHNPRGSNNRLDEASRERQNGKRLFDSQNNNRGGYNVGSVYYYEGSILPIEWTNQHSCNDPNNHCEIIIQYMCHDNLRDGVTTSTIPDGPMNCARFECNTDSRYGMHEDYMYYQQCKLRQRNRGLFTADQKLDKSGRHHQRQKRGSATNTRQNPQGTRYGYECAEERDYYPYWHSSPWKDIAVLTNNASRCPYYQRESENVKSRYYCHLPADVLMRMMARNERGIIPNNEADCQSFHYPLGAGDVNATRGVWRAAPSHGIHRPDCRETENTRDNHLGNGADGYPVVYNWTVPAGGRSLHEQCVLRIRYNISTGDYEGWGDGSSTVNGSSPLHLSTHYGLDAANATTRGYRLAQNPQVQIFAQYPGIKLKLAINTAQFGRTFQDRSHRFGIRARPVDGEWGSGRSGDIYNLNVRGKRGNIVQTYPAVEYDFIPNTLHLVNNDYIHLQWTGSNTNPRNNDGQGLAGTDRSNLVLQRSAGEGRSAVGEYGQWSVSYPQHVTNSTLLGLTPTDIIALATLNTGQYGGEMSELDDAGTYFDLSPPRRVTSAVAPSGPTTGEQSTYHFMCTRNNNFSNRSHKGRLVVSTHRTTTVAVGWNGANITIPHSTTAIYIDRGVFDSLHKLQIEELSREDGEETLKSHSAQINAGDDFASNFIIIHPQEHLTTNDGSVRVELAVDAPLDEVTVYGATGPSYSTWSRHEVQSAGPGAEGRVTFLTQRGGLYVARSHSNVGTIVAAAVCTIIILLGLILGSALYFRRHPGKWHELTQRGRRVHRSVKGRV